jgi:hypothetical protein
MAKFDSKVDGNQVSGDEYNNIVVGLKNVITSSDQTIDTSNTQITKGIADYAAVGTFYAESGTANAYVLSSIGSRLAPNAYAEGMEIRFRAGNSNTGASTVNVAGLGLKNIKKADGSTDIESGDISTDYDTRARYDGTVFRLSSFSDVNNLSINGKLNSPQTTQTISSGAITYNQMVINIRGEGNSDDTLTTINGGTSGDILILSKGGTEDVTLDSGAGNIVLRNGANRLLTEGGDKITLYYDGTNWTPIAIESSRDFQSSSATNGYTYLPNGKIFQFGRSTTTIGTNTTINITFPLTFNTDVYTAYCQPVTYGGSNDECVQVSCVATTTSNLRITNHDNDTTITQIRWFAMGE